MTRKFDPPEEHARFTTHCCLIGAFSGLAFGFLFTILDFFFVGQAASSSWGYKAPAITIFIAGSFFLGELLSRQVRLAATLRGFVKHQHEAQR